MTPKTLRTPIIRHLAILLLIATARLSVAADAWTRDDAAHLHDPAMLRYLDDVLVGVEVAEHRGVVDEGGDQLLVVSKSLSVEELILLDHQAAELPRRRQERRRQAQRKPRPRDHGAL